MMHIAILGATSEIAKDLTQIIMDSWKENQIIFSLNKKSFFNLNCQSFSTSLDAILQETNTMLHQQVTQRLLID